ncbi:MAG: aldehyde-activating protein [Betaproteobacteria bacterium RIFCSPLOWO2_02_FULL_67_26]|nr:MAG: aldehyde-activating protein [Betaproteobacteria bacterium RIFCSPLOWO2_02_FULL_67_26]
MPTEFIKGSCLCGSVKFEIKPPLAAFRYCNCSRCRKASGSAHAANVFLPQGQFAWSAGEELIQRFNLPGAKRFAVWFCSRCGSRVPHKVREGDNYLIPAGLLDDDPVMRPENSIFWGSRAPWYVEPHEMPRFTEYPG